MLPQQLFNKTDPISSRRVRESPSEFTKWELASDFPAQGPKIEKLDQSGKFLNSEEKKKKTSLKITNIPDTLKAASHLTSIRVISLVNVTSPEPSFPELSL